MFKAANVQHFVEKWKELKVPNVVLEWVENGAELPFTNDCYPSFYLKNYKKHSESEIYFMKTEISGLVESGAIKKVKERPTCVSPITCVPKKGKNKYRLITDLRELNLALNTPFFKYEDIDSVTDIIEPDDYFVSLDVKNGFLHVPIAEHHQQFLGIEFQGEYYIWSVACFGLSCAPYLFNKLLKPISDYLVSEGHKLKLYVDDFLLAGDIESIEVTKKVVIETLEALGIILNYQKCSLIPSKTIRYIGYVITSNNTDGCVWISVPKDRVRSLKNGIRRVLFRKSCGARELARILGQCVSMSKAVLPGKLLLRNAYRLLTSRQSWGDRLPLDEATEKDLNWWLELQEWNGAPVQRLTTIDCQIVTDASATGYGGTCNGKAFQGLWDQESAKKSSNVRELLTILLAMKTFIEDIKGKSIQILTDNVSAVAYINYKGGPAQELTEISKAIWCVALDSGMKIKARHLAGKLNKEADRLSRPTKNSEWILHPKIFKFLEKMWGPHTVDRFASLTSTQLERYNSLHLDPGSEGVDAIAQQNWETENNYVNAPFHLLPQVLDTVMRQRAVATVIAPWWKGKNWLKTLQQLSTTEPIRLPNNTRSCIQVGPQGNPEPLKNRRWRLYAWRISGRKA